MYSIVRIKGLSIIGVFVLVLVVEAKAKQDTVMVISDEGPGSLRQLIADQSNAGDTIRFSSLLDGDTITLTEELIIEKDVIIIGNDSTKTIISGGDSTRIFYVNTDTKLVIESMSLVRGNGAGLIVGVPGRGGAIFNLGHLEVISSRMTDNNAFEGGAISSFYDTTIISNCSIIGNSAIIGGGISVIVGGYIELTNCTVNSNQSEGAGGGVHLVSSGTYCEIHASIIKGNTAGGHGGGIFNSSGARTNIYNSRIEENTALEDGGGIINFNGTTVTLTDTKVLNNSAKSGGGIYSRNNVEMYRSVVASNVCSRIGGGMYNLTSLKMNNSVFSGNKAGWFGGAVANNGPGSEIMSKNSTIAGNVSQVGGGIWNNRGHVIAANTIIAKNSDSGQGANMTSFGSSFVTDLGNNLIGDTTGVVNRFPNSTLKGSKSNPVDPMFISDVDTAPSLSGDLRLQCASPGIDAGIIDTSGLDIGINDLIGQSRILGQRIDIGAYENAGSRDLHVDQTSVTNGTSIFQAIDHLTSDAILNQDMIFKSGQSISLTHGFCLSASKMLELEIGECED